MNLKSGFCCLLITLLSYGDFSSYPIDGYEVSGIRRLKRLQLIMDGGIKDAKPISGAQKSIKDIKLNLPGTRGDSLNTIPAPDPEFQKAINSLFPSLHESYSVAVLVITPGKKIRYASRKETGQYQPGSVGKIAVAAGFFTELKKIYPESFAKRQELMRTRHVRAGTWAMTDSHTVPFFDPETKKFFKRTVQEEDVFSLYEWLDHMLSVSNNGAASVCWREAILMRAFGKSYPMLTEEKSKEYFRNTPKSELSDIAVSVVNDPLRALGITEDEWRLGTLFTKGGGSYIPAKGGSTGSPLGLMKFLIAMERGRAVDKESSLEMKRLLYMTDRRIRYATAPALADAAVYFKSGSLYKCKQEEGYSCEKYKGNVLNYMNSVAIIEHPDGATYMVALMSNVLKKNSASDHQSLASGIEKSVRSTK
ncbi:MAG: serine hydrolase [Bacteroidota bacterium]